jgi:hypothetical protein
MSNSDTFNINNLNSLIQQASATIGCDTNCQQQRNIELLHQQMLDAEVNNLTSENQLQVATKNYMTVADGTTAYNSYLTDDLTSKATQIAEVFQTNFNNESNNVKSSINVYNGLVANYNNVEELHAKYVKENEKLEKEYKKKNFDTITNERKTQYQDQGIQNLHVYHKILFYIYMIVIIMFIIFCFTRQSSYSWKIKLAVVIIFIILYFVSSYLVSYFINVCYKLYSLLPKNVHLSI